VFARGSRYERVAEDVYVDARGHEVPFKLLRLLPPALPAVQSHLVVAGDRLDLLAHGYLGNPELFWRICDANAALRPEELTDELGRLLAIPLGAP
jgi:hypothetical protein